MRRGWLSRRCSHSSDSRWNTFGARCWRPVRKSTDAPTHNVTPCDRPAARTSVYFDEFDNVVYALMLSDDTYALLNTLSAPDELADITPTFLAILASISTDAPVPEATDDAPILVPTPFPGGL